MVDQGLASGINFTLLLAVGRRTGSAALGLVSIGFAAYLLALLLQRALMTDPLIVSSAGRHEQAKGDKTGATLTLTLALSAILGTVMAIVGSVASGSAARGLLMFAPWVPAALIQDTWRFVLFRDLHGRSAAGNTGLRMAVMAILLPLGWMIGSPFALVAAWGLGATLGAAYGFRQVPVSFQAIRQAWGAWRESSWPLGSWLGLEGAMNQLGAQGAIFVLATFLPAAALGGLRAGNSIFAPLSLVGPAIALPGLPAIVAALQRSPSHARRLAFKLSGLTAILATAYMVILMPIAGDALRVAFGPSFVTFSNLFVPIALGQILVAFGVGPYLLLKALSSGRMLTAASVAGAAVSITAALMLGRAAGIVGAAWGLTIGSGMAAAIFTTAAIAFRLRASPQAWTDGVHPALP